VNVRLTERQAEALAAIEFLDRVSGPEFLRDLLQKELTRRERDPLYVRALQLRAESEGRSRGDVLRFPEAR